MRGLIESGSFTSAYVTFATDINWIAGSKCFRASSDLSILHEWLIIAERSIRRCYSITLHATSKPPDHQSAMM